MTTGEYRIFGPPGTGKTSFLHAQIDKWRSEYDPTDFCVGSFTRTAAAEIAGRLLDEHGQPTIPESNVGTLHALCYRAIDRPEIAETHVDEWNEQHKAFPLSAGFDRQSMEDTGVDPTSTSTDADLLQQTYERLRARRVERRLWPLPVQGFADRWESWLRAEGYVDFTGMIEAALDDVPCAPGNPAVGLFDEVQDFTALELALVRKWGDEMERLVLAGDDDQCIYSFKGATPDAFLDPPVDADHKKTLGQSWRLPEQIRLAAEQWIERLSRREPKVYRARTDDNGNPVDGSVAIETKRSLANPGPLVDEIGEVVESGRTVMVLATCSYMLDKLRSGLREAGLPFHNPYRAKRGDWNPLAIGREGRRSASDRLLAYLRPDVDVWGDEARRWTGEDLKSWTQPLGTKDTMTRGSRKLIDSLPGLDTVSAVWLRDTLFAPLDPSEFHPMLGGQSLDWFETRLLKSRRKAFEYPLRVARLRGAATLRQPPQVIIGTIHSVKGGQADVVYLSPDLSIPGANEYGGSIGSRDAVIRQFYVGITRARERLVVLGHSPGSEFVDPRSLAGGETT